MSSRQQQTRRRRKSSSKDSTHCPVQVYLRCRPMNKREKHTGDSTIVKCNHGAGEVVISKGGMGFDKAYAFHSVFGPESTQADVYETVASPIVSEVLSGYNCTIFCYGQTGAGKTFTMEGATGSKCGQDEKAGIIPRAVHHIFQLLEASPEKEYSVRVSHMELYNEELIDLLGSDCKPLKLFQDATAGVKVAGLEEIPVMDADNIFSVLKKSNAKRTTAETDMNHESSRSHCIFTISIHTKETTTAGEDLIRVGKLNLVDLAGSENVGRSGAKEGRKREAGLINQSLLTLGRVITKLTEKSRHVPYRESKLTRLLQESLGGRAKTCIIASVSPASSNYEETLSTLDYASRAKDIQNKPEVNQKLTKRALIKEYVDEIDRIKRALFAAREKNGVYLPEQEWTEMQAKAEAQQATIAELEAALEQQQTELAALQATWKATSQQLEVTQGELTDTQGQLDVTEHALADRGTHLLAARHALLAQGTVVARQASTAQRLHRVACENTEVLSHVHHDVQALHAKLDRKAATEQAVEHTLKDAEQRLVAGMQRVRDMAQSWSQEQGARHDVLQQRLQALHDRHSQASGTVHSMVHELRTMVRARCDTVSAASQAQAEGTEQATEAWARHEGRHAADVGALVTDFVTQAHTVMQDWSQALAAHRADAEAWMCEQSRVAKAGLERVTTLAEREASLLAEVRAAASQHLGDAQERTRARQAAMEHWMEAQQAEAQAEEAALRDAMTQLLKRHREEREARLVQGLAELTLGYEEDVDAAETAQTQLCADVGCVQAVQMELADVAQTSLGALDIAVTQHGTQVMAHADESELRAKGLTARCTKHGSAIHDTLANLSQQASDECAQLRQRAQGAMAATQGAAAVATTMEWADALDALQDQETEATQAWVSQVGAHGATMQQANQTMRSALDQDQEALMADARRLCDELPRDQATGETPVKRAYAWDTTNLEPPTPTSKILASWRHEAPELGHVTPEDALAWDDRITVEMDPLLEPIRDPTSLPLGVGLVSPPASCPLPRRPVDTSSSPSSSPVHLGNRGSLDSCQDGAPVDAGDDAVVEQECPGLLQGEATGVESDDGTEPSNDPTPETTTSDSPALREVKPSQRGSSGRNRPHASRRGSSSNRSGSTTRSSSRRRSSRGRLSSSSRDKGSSRSMPTGIQRGENVAPSH